MAWNPKNALADFGSTLKRLLTFEEIAQGVLNADQDALRVEAQNGGAAVSPSNPLPVGATNYEATVTFTRPSNTTPYDALDVIGAADAGTPANAGDARFELTNIGPAGGYVFLTDVLHRIDVAALPSGMGAFRLHFFNAQPTAILDNAAFNLVAADRAKYLGFVQINTPDDLGDTLWSENVQRNKRVKLADGLTSLWVELQTLNGYTPTSAAVKTLRVASVRA